jgi:uncharacterized damage-inducible protein DinB
MFEEWFAREFPFDLPIWMYPNIVERLRGTPARCEELASTLTSEVLTKKYGEQWSIQENIGHLWDLEPLWFGRTEELLRGEARLRAADLTNRKTEEAEHNQISTSLVLSKFRADRMKLLEKLRGVDEKLAARSALHPRLEKPMRLMDLMFFVAEHDDHHLAQISRLKEAQ